MSKAALAAVALSLSAVAFAAAGEPAAFPVREPARPLALKLDTRPAPEWGHTPPLRAVYYAYGLAPNDLDRQTILRELRLIRDFYGHYGLRLDYEPRVYEVQGDTRSYHAIERELRSRGLLLPRRTIVFTTFDVGLGGDMALTGLNDANVRALECPPKGPGKAWWCGYPEDAHWGGSVHEVGHMLGLSHPSREADKTVMGRHYLFFRHADNGLLPEEVRLLRDRFGQKRARGVSAPRAVRNASDRRAARKTAGSLSSPRACGSRARRRRPSP